MGYTSKKRVLILNLLSIVECIGYCVRAVAHNQTGKIVPFAVQNSMILLAPVFLAATIYATFGRITRSANAEKFSIIRPDWVTKLFVTGDVVSLMVQGSAAGLMLMAGHMKMGQSIVIVGLIIQILLFGLFWVIAAIFHLRMRRTPTGACVSQQVVRWERQIYLLYSVSALVMLRSVFRLIEFIMGQDGYLLTTEWPLYVFDSIPMLVVMIIFSFSYDGTTERSMGCDSITSLSVLGRGSREMATGSACDGNSQGKAL